MNYIRAFAVLLCLSGSAVASVFCKSIVDWFSRTQVLSNTVIGQLPGMIHTLGFTFMLIGIGMLMLSCITKTSRVGRDAVLLGLFASACLVFYSHVEKMVGLHDHQAWDGVQYYAMYHFFCDGSYGSVTGLAAIFPSFPYTQRVLVPLLVSFVPTADPILGFRLVNSAFLIMAVMAFYVLWVKYCRFAKTISIIGILFFLFHWVAPIRELCDCVYTVDPPVYLFEALFLCAVFSKKYLWLIPLSAVSVLCKEQFFFIFLVFFIFALFVNLQTKRQEYPLVILGGATVLAFLTSLVLTNFPFKAQGSGLLIIAHWGLFRLNDPLSFVRWIVAVFTAYGMFGILACMKPLPVKRDHFAELAVLTSLVLAFSLLGGSDLTRISFLGFPFVMTLILMIIQNDEISTLCAAALTLPVMRLLSNIPDPANPLPSNDTAGIYSWMMEYADIGIVAGWGVYFLIFGFALSRVKEVNLNFLSHKE